MDIKANLIHLYILKVLHLRLISWRYCISLCLKLWPIPYQQKFCLEKVIFVLKFCLLFLTNVFPNKNFPWQAYWYLCWLLLFRKVPILLYFYLFIILVSLHKQKFTFPYFLLNIIPSRTYTESEKTFVWYFLKDVLFLPFIILLKMKFFTSIFLEILLGFLRLFISNYLKSR